MNTQFIRITRPHVLITWSLTSESAEPNNFFYVVSYDCKVVELVVVS